MKISIIGTGRVGSSIAFAILSTISTDLVLMDTNKDKAQGEAEDLSHAFSKEVLGTDLISEIKDSDFVVMTAGKARFDETKSERSSAGTRGTSSVRSREELAKENTKIVSIVAAEIEKYAPESMVLMVTNPSTKMVEVARQKCSNEVIDMGVELDNTRLKFYGGKGIVLGPHGEDMKFDEETNEEILDKVRTAGKRIIQRKGHTNWGIAQQITKTIKNRWVKQLK